MLTIGSQAQAMKKARIKKHIYETPDLATEDIAEYIDGFCDRTRRHTHLGGVSPDHRIHRGITREACPLNLGNSNRATLQRAHLSNAYWIRPEPGVGHSISLLRQEYH